MTPKLQLYCNRKMSPPSRFVFLTANLLGIELDLIHVNLLAGDQLKAEFIKVGGSVARSLLLCTVFFLLNILHILSASQLNPQHTIPLLVDRTDANTDADDDAIVIHDSHAICTYLVERYGHTDAHRRLYPKDLRQRAQVDARLHFDTGVLFARLRMLFEPILYHGCREMPAEKVEYIQRAWPLLEAFLNAPADANNGTTTPSPYLCGAHLTLGDVACMATVCSASRVAPIAADRFPKLVQWTERMAAELPRFASDGADTGLQDYLELRCRGE